MKKKMEPKLSEDIIVFKSDNTILRTSEKDLPKSKEIEFLLIPITSFNSTAYIYLNPHKFLHLKEATVSFKFNVSYSADCVRENTITLNDGEITTSSLVELTNMIYSLSRYKRVCSFEIEPYAVDGITMIDIYPEYFHLHIENLKGDIYDCEINPGMTRAEVDKIITHLNQDLLNTENKEMMNLYGTPNKYLVIRNNTWEFKKSRNLKPYDILGISSAYHNTIIFINCDDYDVLASAIHSMSVQLITFDPQTINDIDHLTGSEIQDILATDVVASLSAFHWVNETDELITFIDLLPAYASLIDAIVKMYQAKYHPDDHDVNKLTQIILFCIDFLSVKYPSEILSMYRDDLPSLGTFIHLMRALKDKYL